MMMRYPVFAAALATLAALAGCYVPVSTSAPQDPRALGQGAWGASASIEYAPVDMLETVTTAPEAAAPGRYPITTVPAYRLELQRGLTPETDVSLGVEGGVYVALPLPHGVSAGIRHHWIDAAWIDLGLALRMGYVGFFATRDDAPLQGSKVGVTYAALTANARFGAVGGLHPGLAITVQPMRVTPDLREAAIDDLFALGLSTTISVTYRGITPFVDLGLVTSDNIRGTAPRISAGLAKSWR